MDIVSLCVQLLSGAVGGNLAGSLLKNSSLGTLGNSLVGILGGGLGGQLLSLAGIGAASAGGGMDLGSILSSVASGGVGGGVLMAIIGMVRQSMTRSA